MTSPVVPPPAPMSPRARRTAVVAVVATALLAATILGVVGYTLTQVPGMILGRPMSVFRHCRPVTEATVKAAVRGGLEVTTTGMARDHCDGDVLRVEVPDGRRVRASEDGEMAQAGQMEAIRDGATVSVVDGGRALELHLVDSDDLFVLLTLEGYRPPIAPPLAATRSDAPAVTGLPASDAAATAEVRSRLVAQWRLVLDRLGGRPEQAWFGTQDLSSPTGGRSGRVGSVSVVLPAGQGGRPRTKAEVEQALAAAGWTPDPTTRELVKGPYVVWQDEHEGTWGIMTTTTPRHLDDAPYAGKPVTELLR